MRTSIGDLAQNLLLRRHSTDLRASVERLTFELSTGRDADQAAKVRGNFSAVASIERSLTTIESYEIAATETTLFFQTAQTSLGAVEDVLTTLGPSLLITAQAGNAALVRGASIDAESRFKSAVSALNVDVGGRGLFGGIATDSAALADADTILADLFTAVSAETTASGVKTVVDTWFDTGGDFETVAYTGSTTSLDSMRIAERHEVSITFTAQDDRIREALKGMALAALVGRDIPNGNAFEQIELGRLAAETMIEATAGIVSLRADIGVSEATIEQARVETAAERTAMILARAELVEIDPYETAIELESVQTQLDTLYTLTSRLSRLSLVNYIR